MSIENEYQYALELYKQKQYKEAYDCFHVLAKHNDANSQEMIANMTYYGLAVKKDKEHAFYWYEKAAKNGNAEAQYWHGRKKLEQNNVEEGILWIKKSAHNNNPDALRSLGLYYLNGDYFDKSVNKAIVLFQKAFFEFENKDAFLDLLRALGIKYNKIEIFLLYLKILLKCS